MTTITTTTADEYNGWTNRETWAVALHIDNDAWLYGLVIELAESLIASGLSHNAAVASLADRLQEQFDEMEQDMFDAAAGPGQVSDAMTGMFRDIGSLWRVNWHEVASGYFDSGLWY